MSVRAHKLLLTPNAAPAALLSAGLALALSYALLNWRPFSDEGSFCVIAQGILAGKLPYRDLFNEKAPLQYVWTAMFLALFGQGLTAVRLVPACALAGLSAWGAHALVRAGGKPWHALAWPLVLLPAAMAMQAFNNTAESSLAALLLWAAWLHGCDAAHPPLSRRALAAGFVMGVAAGFKQTALLPALMLVLLPSSRGRRLEIVAGFGSAAVLFFAGLGLWGNLGSFFESAVLFHFHNPGTSSYFRGPSVSDYCGILFFLLAAVPPLILCLGPKAYSLKPTAYSPKPTAHDPLLLAGAAALPFLARMDAFRLWPAFVLLAALDARLWASRGFRLRPMLVAAALLGVCWLAFSPAQTWSTFERYEQVVPVVARYSGPDEPIWVGPMSPPVYCLAHRAPASRYYFLLPWTAKPQVVAELMGDLGRKRPPVIIDNSGPFIGTQERLTAMLPALSALLAAEYQETARVGDSIVYVRKDRAGPSPLTPNP